VTTNYPGDAPREQQPQPAVGSTGLPQYPPPGWTQDQFDRALNDQSHPLVAQAANAPNQVASMGARFGGLVLDWVVLAVVSAGVSFALGLGESHHSRICSTDGGGCRTQTNYSFGNSGTLVWFLVCLVYFGLLVGLTGRSLGHRAAGIRVVDFQTGRNIGVFRAGWRWTVLAATGAILTLGFWSPFFNDLRRGWHDMAGRALVVKNR